MFCERIERNGLTERHAAESKQKRLLSKVFLFVNVPWVLVFARLDLRSIWCEVSSFYVRKKCCWLSPRGTSFYRLLHWTGSLQVHILIRKGRQPKLLSTDRCNASPTSNTVYKRHLPHELDRPQIWILPVDSQSFCPILQGVCGSTTKHPQESKREMPENVLPSDLQLVYLASS